MTAPIAHGRRRTAGFTLLEVLVALVVVGLILLGLAQGVHFGLLAWGTETRVAGRNADLDTFDTMVRHVIEGADPGSELDPAPFVGRSDRLGCITALPNAWGATPHRRIEAVLMVDAQHRLVMRWRPYVHAIPLKPLPAANDTELLDDVARVQFSYWQPNGGWISGWPSTDLPPLVRVHVEFASGDPRHWPDVVAAPRLNRP